MKKVFLIISLITSVASFSQVDSSITRISGIVLKGKEFKIVAFFCMTDSKKYPTLDSIVKTISFPQESDDVTFNSVPNRQWYKMQQDFKNSKVCLLQSAFKRLDDELRLHGSVWLIWRLNNDNVNGSDIDYDNTKKAGSAYAKKDDTNN